MSVLNDGVNSLTGVKSGKATAKKATRKRGGRKKAEVVNEQKPETTPEPVSKPAGVGAGDENSQEEKSDG